DSGSGQAKCGTFRFPSPLYAGKGQKDRARAADRFGEAGFIRHVLTLSKRTCYKLPRLPRCAGRTAPQNRLLTCAALKCAVLQCAALQGAAWTEFPMDGA